jgi:pilus assembly protein FimV
VHNSKLKQITIALCMALLPISVFAAGLGKLNVTSALGEPLRADIELLSVTPDELSSIVAAIASEEAYANQGIERPSSHNSIKVDVAKNSRGAPVLKLRSSLPISEPFLDMLLQVDWNSGRLLREYTVLLDPPGYTGEADTSTSTTQAPMVKPSTAPSEDKMLAPAPQDAMAAPAKSTGTKRSNRHNRAPRNPAPEAAPVESNGQEYTTQRGDTLNKIARDMKPEGVSLEQMLVGLYQANPNAFDARNMNRLKVGQILKQPSEEALNAISRKIAVREIRVHSSNWNAYRNKLAGIVKDAAPSEAEAPASSSSGKIKSAAEDKSMPAAGAKDVVKLSAGDAAAAKGGSGDVKAMQAKISALQEEVTAREKSVKEAQDRTVALEKQVADMQKLIAMKSGAMADLQKQAEAQNKPVEGKPVESKPAEIKPAEANPVNAKPVEAKPVEAKPVETAKPAEEVKPAEATPVVPTPVEPAKPEAAKPPVVPAATPVEEPGFLASLTSPDGMLGGLDLPVLGGIGGTLAVLGAGWLYLRKKRERNLADFEQGIMTSGGLKANTVFGNTSGSNVDTGDTSFLTDFSQSTSGGMIDTNDVDPIAEAEVYMAYGRDAQAEEILKDAITKEPKRHELHLKLLEIYAASKNMSGFETIAGELYTTLGAEDPTWAKVAEIGIELEPNNPLYQAGASPTGSVANSSDANSSVSKAAADSNEKFGATDKLNAFDFTDSPLAGEHDLMGETSSVASKDADFSFDNYALVENFASSDTSAKGEYDLDFGAEAESMKAATPDVETYSAADIASKAKDTSLDFDMGELMATPAAAHVQEVAAAESVEFEFPKFEAAEAEPSPNQLGGIAAAALPVAAAAMTADVFDFPKFDTGAQDEVADISDNAKVFDSAEHTEDSDFNFDIEAMSPEAAANLNDVTNLPEVSTYDLSGVSFDMDDTPTLASTEEPIQVETKLDLVAAYIEMDDKEGAKELLAEVMKEGGASQRQRAETLLAKIA